MITPSDAQAAAVDQVVDWFWNSPQQEFYLAGYAGTGKSTTAAVAIDELGARRRAPKVRTGAYTGKAASVLRKKGVDSATTIHGMIYRPVENDDGTTEFKLDLVSSPAADADLIVLDECSMVSDEIANDLRQFGKKILVMGDPGQLPPVNGQGAFTRRKPDVFLSEIHRQAAGSPILRLATMARKGERIPPGDYGDGVVVQPLDRDSQRAVYSQSTQAICGIHRVRWVYTQRIRRLLDFTGPLPLRGERIMCCRNNKDLGIFNGQQGVALRDTRGEEGFEFVEFDVEMEDRPGSITDLLVHPYLLNQHFDGPTQRPRIPREVSEMDWGYVLTCHKAQGSEWPHVTIVDDSASFREDRSKWLYTAITRASEGLTLLQRAA